jgi:hypothetical protein
LKQLQNIKQEIGERFNTEMNEKNNEIMRIERLYTGRVEELNNDI